MANGHIYSGSAMLHNQMGQGPGPGVPKFLASLFMCSSVAGHVVRVLDLQTAGHGFRVQTMLTSASLASCLHTHVHLSPNSNWYEPMDGDAL